MLIHYFELIHYYPAIVSFITIHFFSILFLCCNIYLEKQLFFDFRLISSNRLLYVSYFSWFKIVLCFRNVLYCFFFYLFFFLLLEFLIPPVIQGLKCFFCFNLSLATEKNSSYSESIMLTNLIYASLAFLHCLTLLQFIPSNLNLNVPIDWSENMRLYINSFVALHLRQYNYNKRKLEHDWRCQFL